MTVYVKIPFTKHGNHNQKDHAGKTGNDHGFTVRTKEQEVAFWNQFYEKQITDPAARQKMAERMYETRDFDYYDGPNGTKVTVNLKQMTPERQANLDAVFSQAAEMQRLAPRKDVQITIDDNAFRTQGMPLSTQGFVLTGEKVIHLRSTVLDNPKPDKGLLMPSVDNHGMLRYTVAHEWGHVVDGRGEFDSARDFNSVKSKDGLSKYGQTNKREAFAEAMAEWALSSGSSSNPTVKYFADTYEWADRVRKDDSYPNIMIIDTFSSDLLPEEREVTSMAKSVLVRMPLRVSKHLQGKHDQKTHGKGGGGEYDEWGERAAAIRAMADSGPTADELAAGVDAASGDGDVDDDEIREFIDNDEYMQSLIEDSVEEAREEYARDMVERGFDMEDEDFYEDFDEEYIRDRAAQDLHEMARDNLYEAANEREGLAIQEAGSRMHEVFDITHEGVSISGQDVRIRSAVEAVEGYSGRVKVEGTLYDDETGEPIGEFTRGFYRDRDGKITVEHELLRFHPEFEDEYGGAGFAQAFNRQAENYYISHGIENVYVHAAITGGGHAWAKQGFDWQNNSDGDYGISNVRGRINAFDKRDLPGPMRDALTDAFDRLHPQRRNSPDFPTPNEIAMLGYVPGAKTWPGKEIMRGSNWYGVKKLSPTGPRKSSVERALEEARKPNPNQLKFDFTKPKPKSTKPRDGDGDGRTGAAEARDDKAFRSWLGQLYRDQN